MASVTSLDQDMRKLRLDRYTPAAAAEVRSWIEDTLGELLAPGDLMEALRDGVALCKLVKRAVPPGVKFKESSMPFVQMENISHFLKACESPPLSLPAHDRFLTVDLYDGKDPTQVLQCIAAFSRRANALNPSAFPQTIGAKSKGGLVSPQGTGGKGISSGYTTTARERGMSNTADSPALGFNPLNKAAYSGRISPSKSGNLSRGGLATGGPVSSWSTDNDKSSSAPAWNIHQYGYMGGASQGNQGVAFGSRRQIISSTPDVPSLEAKEKQRREEADRKTREAELENQRKRAEAEADEKRAQQEEMRRWEGETKRLRRQEEEEELQLRLETEIKEAEAQAREFRRQSQDLDFEAQEQRAQQERERRQLERNAQDEKDRQGANIPSQTIRPRQQRVFSDPRLNGQYLSQLHGSTEQPPQAASITSATPSQESTSPANPISSTTESDRIAELERQLAELKSLQTQNTSDRVSAPAPAPAAVKSRPPPAGPKPSLPSRTSSSISKPPPQPPKASHEDDWDVSERDHLQKAWQREQSSSQIPTTSSRPTTVERTLSSQPQSTRPLPDPATYTSNTNRTDRFLSSNPAPSQPQPSAHRPQDYSTTSEVDAENQRRIESQHKTKAGGWASKSLLEREMERERERQREWEQNQADVATRAPNPDQGSAPGQSWSTLQYGYMGGDHQGRNPNLGLQGGGGGRRQIIGPRPPP